LFTSAVLAALLASCGEGQLLPGGPAPGTANINGSVVEGSGGRVASARGDEIGGIRVWLVDTATRDVVAGDVTDAQGVYTFRDIPTGPTYWLQLEFDANRDLDGNGANDHILLSVPIRPEYRATVSVVQRLGLKDLDNDGQADTLVFESQVSDNLKHTVNRNIEHRFRTGETRLDSNHDGEYDDSEAFADPDGDGLPGLPDTN
jgi:hypothetical protein